MYVYIHKRIRLRFNFPKKTNLPVTGCWLSFVIILVEYVYYSSDNVFVSQVFSSGFRFSSKEEKNTDGKKVKCGAHICRGLIIDGVIMCAVLICFWWIWHTSNDLRNMAECSKCSMLARFIIVEMCNGLVRISVIPLCFNILVCVHFCFCWVVEEIFVLMVQLQIWSFKIVSHYPEGFETIST